MERCSSRVAPNMAPILINGVTEMVRILGPPGGWCRNRAYASVGPPVSGIVMVRYHSAAL